MTRFISEDLAVTISTPREAALRNIWRRKQVKTWIVAV
jgi:hypothetical protein